MSIAKTTEISAGSKVSFDDAIRMGMQRATKTLDNVKSAWVQSQEVIAGDGAIDEYRVHLKVTFILDD